MVYFMPFGNDNTVLSHIKKILNLHQDTQTMITAQWIKTFKTGLMKRNAGLMAATLVCDFTQSS